ncbi:hypothetical protein F8M41_014748 [Gigaspora margarita]|uniref:Uncharacterized protein n=1 Tax=Gigaspora margarita TaxID=4874 RepID=A0A8H4AR55_GIGMA|nr:hypothetical protein F8M41_014748 [Gigaspora margarita]
MVGSGAKLGMCSPNVSEAFVLNSASFYFILTTMRFFVRIDGCDLVSHPVDVPAATREDAVDFLSTRIHEIVNINYVEASDW